MSQEIVNNQLPSANDDSQPKKPKQDFGPLPGELADWKVGLFTLTLLLVIVVSYFYYGGQ